MSPPVSPCAGIGPTAPASLYGLVQFIIVMIGIVFMLVTLAATLYMRRFRRRLRLRSLLPLLLGTAGGILIMAIRAAYDLVGIEHFPCTLNVTLFYLYPFLVVSMDLVAITNFLAKQYKRQTFNANTLQALTKLEQDEEFLNRRVTVRQYFKGLWNFILGVLEVTSFTGRFNEKFWFRTQHLRLSLVREVSYELFTALLFTTPFFIALIIRVYTVPSYRPEAGCTGCLLGWEDLVIVTAITGMLGVPIALLLLRARLKSIPDPLNYIFDVEICFFIMTPLVEASAILFSVDPGGLMRSQQVDWFVFDFASILFIHCFRTVIQLARARRMQKLGEANVRLLDILSDAKGAILFEKHLIAELANENLLFWREAIKYKLQFDRNRDFEISQQTAKVIYRTFVSPNAMFPINIGSEMRRSLDARFKQGTVSRNVFDDALIEVYLMMQDGAFRRFVNSAPFKEFSKTRADFSLSTLGVFNPMTVVPDDTNPAAPPSHMNIREYIQSL